MEFIVDKAKEEFIKTVHNFGSDPYHLLPHVKEAEKWAEYFFSKYPKAKKEIILLSVWLHDIGHYPIQKEIDHAITSEEFAKKFLRDNNYPLDETTEVLHCIRAHRCKDVMPNSFEAKIMAFIDSASHATTSMYFDMAKDDKDHGQNFRVYSKMQRDIRDLSSFPQVQNELKELFDAWDKLIKAYEKLNLS